jgi:RNA polymerase sigma factor (sigma-70 family)
MSGKSAPQATEAELLERLGAGDPNAYRTLSELHLKPIFNHNLRVLGNRAEAEDVTQETFLKLWQTPPRSQATTKLSTWLYRVAHNQCVDQLRRRRDTTSDEELATDSARPSHVLERRQTAEAIRQALGRLPLRQHSALCLSHYDGMSNPEISEVLGVSVEAVESLLSRARRALRDELKLEGQST